MSNLPDLTNLTEDAIKTFIRGLGARADAFGTTAIPLSAAEFITAVRVGAVTYVNPLNQGGGFCGEYCARIDGRPLHIYDSGRELVSVAA